MARLLFAFGALLSSLCLDAAGQQEQSEQAAQTPKARILALEADLKVLDARGRALKQEQARLEAATGPARERLERDIQTRAEAYQSLLASTQAEVRLARKEFPRDARVRRFHLPFALGGEKLEEALEDLRVITEAAPSDPDMGLAKARLLLRLGTPEEVLELIRELRKATGRPSLGSEPLLEALGGLCRFSEILVEIAKVEGALQAPEHLVGLKAETLFQLGDYEEARRVARAALSEVRRNLEQSSDPERAQRFQALMGQLGGLAEAAALYPAYLEQERRAIAAEEAAGDCPRVVLRTSRGPILVELFEDSAPNTVASFITLAEKGFFDGTRFHRVIPGFMAQGGDPNTRAADPSAHGRGGPGYFLADECRDPGARQHFAGRLSMANSGPDTAGSQFFITHSATWHLNGRHTVFGRVLEGMATVLALRRGDLLEQVEVLRKREHPYPVIRLGR